MKLRDCLGLFSQCPIRLSRRSSLLLISPSPPSLFCGYSRNELLQSPMNVGHKTVRSSTRSSLHESLPNIMSTRRRYCLTSFFPFLIIVAVEFLRLYVLYVSNTYLRIIFVRMVYLLKRIRRRKKVILPAQVARIRRGHRGVFS